MRRVGWMTSPSWRRADIGRRQSASYGNMRASILEAAAAGPDEIDALAASVEEAARDPATTFYQARIHQVSGRRPSI